MTSGVREQTADHKHFFFLFLCPSYSLFPISSPRSLSLTHEHTDQPPHCRAPPLTSFSHACTLERTSACTRAHTKGNTRQRFPCRDLNHIKKLFQSTSPIKLQDTGRGARKEIVPPRAGLQSPYILPEILNLSQSLLMRLEERDQIPHHVRPTPRLFLFTNSTDHCVRDAREGHGAEKPGLRSGRTQIQQGRSEGCCSIPQKECMIKRPMMRQQNSAGYFIQCNYAEKPI